MADEKIVRLVIGKRDVREGKPDRVITAYPIREDESKKKQADQQAERRDENIERRLEFKAFMNEHREDDKKEQEAIFNEVDRLFLDKKFCPFSYRKGDARIITGEEEGIYGWITLNFLEGRFSPSVKIATLGALDLGGASTQNAYRVSHVGKGVPTVKVHLAGKDYPLYVHSYLGYGLDQATASYFKYLASNSKRFFVVSPCHNKHYLKKLQKTNNRQIVVIGAYNRKKCRNLLKRLLFCKGDAKQCPYVAQPDLEGDFVGMNGYYFVMKDIGAIENQGQAVSFRKFKKVSNKLCKQSSKSLDTSLFQVEDLCFRANYLYELLKDGYHINFNTFDLRVSLEVNGFDLSWALGALLYNTKIL
ncbi:Ectonucleoside triphosphate diphosphohydrolase 1 [Exaiptasia diaphana]|nr:Ectonucleoside triphosphate diphosphohydrolase 1 [Exaiptasia diaphana]